MRIAEIRLKNLLSFRDAAVQLGALNVLIGANASGKTNLIEAIGLLQAAPTSFSAAIQRGGGIRQWLWLGSDNPSSTGTIGCVFADDGAALDYEIQLAEDIRGFTISGERLEKSPAEADLGEARKQSPPEKGESGDPDRVGAAVFFNRSAGHAELGPLAQNGDRNRNEMSVPVNESVFARYKIPNDPTPITRVGSFLEGIRIYREFRTGPASQARFGVSTSITREALVEGGDNLALMLNELDFAGLDLNIRGYLNRFCERFEDVKVRVGSGIAQTFLRERGLSEPIASVRMSDGTLKFLCLLVALFHSSPPPLMCIEEPELGLHPDALQLVAELLVEASNRMQLVVTTHSDALVDALSGRPDAVVVCERGPDDGTILRRLSTEQLKIWLEEYSLGDLWRKGEIGGNRW